MSHAVWTLRIIAEDAREFHAGALEEGFDASDALKEIAQFAESASFCEAIPNSAGFLVQSMLAQTSIDLDIIEAGEKCIDQVLSDRDGALALRAKLADAIAGEEIDEDDAVQAGALRLIASIDIRFADRRTPSDPLIATDAARFRALASCPRILMHGSAGVDTNTGSRKWPDLPGSVHFGAVMMDPSASERHTAWGRSCIIALAEDILASEGGTPPSEPVGTSDEADATRMRALLRCPRINLHAHDGCTVADGVVTPDTDGSFRFSAEYWPRGEPHESGQDDPTLGRACLKALADDLIQRGLTAA